jgi:hypothetical protein
MADERMHEDPERIDLSMLDPQADPGRFEDLLRGVRRAATPELLRRQAGTTLWGQMRRWRRPILVTSGALALAAAVVLIFVQPTRTSSTTEDAFGVPSTVSQWMRSEEKPSPADLLEAEGGSR